MTSPSSQPTPPAEQTTAAEPGITHEEPSVKPERPELTPDHSDNRDPRPSTLATQEIRLALAFTGGVSLAIWMGGVARELDLLVQASERRRILGQDEVDASTPDDDPVRRLYRRLLDLVDAQVAIDVLAGTSAGGINAALLGLANVGGRDLGKLRDIWLTAGDLGQLLRDPREEAPPSLLKGDAHMLPALNEGIRKIIDNRPAPEAPRKTDVFITTTLLSPETSRFSDDYGTQITDTDHHAQFHFDETSLVRDDVVPALALAARSSASFPAAFEPSFVAFGETPGDLHPDMSAYTDATRSHWAADGGLLVNRPIAPVLQSIFDREADRQVRRALLYIVPSSEPPAPSLEDKKAEPLGLAGAMLRDLNAILNQSIAADLAAIKEHNDRTRAAADTRLRLATLGGRLPARKPLADESAWKDYRERQGDWLVAPLMSELNRQLGNFRPMPEAWKPTPHSDQDAMLRSAARAAATESWPTAPPADAAAALDAAVRLGRAAFDTAKATLVHLLRLGYVLSTEIEERNCLARLGMHAHRALSESRRTDLRELVERPLSKAAAADPPTSLGEVVTQLTAGYASAQGTVEQLTAAWQSIGATAADAIPLLRGLAAPYLKRQPATSPAAELAGSGTGRRPLRQRRALAADELSRYLQFLERGDPVTQLLDLHVAVRSVLPVLLEVEQPVELIQVSADTSTSLAPVLSTAASKLTGMQVHHFGAFYATSWRANDWMWGRLDGCGWLVHMLLNPRRILTVMENDNVACGSRGATFAEMLRRAVDAPMPDELQADLRFLDDETEPLPASLPRLAVWVAEVLQRHIVAEELPVVAAHLESEGRDKPYRAADTWLTTFNATGWQKAGEAPRPQVLKDLLSTCPVASQTLRQEARTRTPLYLRTITHAAAVATSASTGMERPPRSLRPTFATARAVTQTAYVAANTTDGRRRMMTLVGIGLLAYGVLAMLTDILVLGLTGLVAFGAGAVLLAFCLGPKTVGVLRLLLALAVVLLAAAPWLPLLDERLFRWLGDTAVPWIHDHRWAWPVLLFLILLPPLTAVSDLAKRARAGRRGAPSSTSGSPAP